MQPQPRIKTDVLRICPSRLCVRRTQRTPSWTIQRRFNLPDVSRRFGVVLFRHAAPASVPIRILLVSKISIERINKIVRLIRRMKSVSMARLKEELEVSEASIKRDIEFLRERLGCPIEWNRSLRGYVIRDDLAQGGRFELPGVWFDSSEVFALLMMLHLVEGVSSESGAIQVNYSQRTASHSTS